jgi:hypothetical protein
MRRMGFSPVSVVDLDAAGCAGGGNHAARAAEVSHFSRLGAGTGTALHLRPGLDQA